MVHAPDGARSSDVRGDWGTASALVFGVEPEALWNDRLDVAFRASLLPELVSSRPAAVNEGVLCDQSGAPGPSGATITILANGTLSPKTVQITVGQSVTFVNSDVRTHDMASDPHPTLTQCPQSTWSASWRPDRPS
jgi:plastocyanin